MWVIEEEGREVARGEARPPEKALDVRNGHVTDPTYLTEQEKWLSAVAGPDYTVRVSRWQERDLSDVIVLCTIGGVLYGRRVTVSGQTLFIVKDQNEFLAGIVRQAVRDLEKYIEEKEREGKNG